MSNTSPAATSTGPRCGSYSDGSSRQQAVLERLLDSSAFSVAERLSRLRAGVGIARRAVGRLQGRDPRRTRAVGATRPRRAQLSSRRSWLSARSGAVSRQETVLVFCSSSRSSSSTRASSFSDSDIAIARAASRRASARRARRFHPASSAGSSVKRSVPLLGHPDVGLDPDLQVADQLERAVMRDAEVRHDDLAPGCSAPGC